MCCGIRVLRPIGDKEKEETKLPITMMSDAGRREVTWRGNFPVVHVTKLSERDGAGPIHLDLAKELEARAQIDADLLDGRLKWVQAYGVLLAAQVVLWGLALVLS